jgi:hypothetical protein
MASDKRISAYFPDQATKKAPKEEVKPLRGLVAASYDNPFS